MTEKHASLTEALAAFQAEIPSVAKSNEAKIVTKDKGTYGYTYADLSDVTDAALPILGKHGLAWVTIPTMDPERGFVLLYSLRHGTESIDGVYPLPAPTTQAQTVGAAISYARRYTLCAVTGIAPGGDDTDAAPPAATEPSEDWMNLIKNAATVEELTKITDRCTAAREVTQPLRNAYAARLGYLERNEVKHDRSDAASGADTGLPASEPGSNGAADHRGEQPARGAE